MNPTPDEIRAAKAEHGSMRGAARALGKAASTLTLILKRAEEAAASMEGLNTALAAPGSKRARGIVTPKARQRVDFKAARAQQATEPEPVHPVLAAFKAYRKALRPMRRAFGDRRRYAHLSPLVSA